jgi:hypothetical protein
LDEDDDNDVFDIDDAGSLKDDGKEEVPLSVPVEEEEVSQVEIKEEEVVKPKKKIVKVLKK